MHVPHVVGIEFCTSICTDKLNLISKGNLCLFTFYFGCVFLKMPQRRRLSTADMNRALGMLESGRSQRQVATTINISQGLTSILFNCFQTSSSVNRRGHEGVN